MRKKIFITKNKRNFYFIFLFILLSILIIYFFSYVIMTNNKYFIISKTEENFFYIIPDDKEGEKVKYIDNNLNNFDNLHYTIQLFSDVSYDNIEKYLKNLLEIKSEIILSQELFIFKLDTDIGTDYFLTYKNFNSKDNALSYCEKLSFIKKCLIIKHNYD